MIDTKAIRAKVLDLAIRGKLTEQLPEDGTAADLYARIQAEKQCVQLPENKKMNCCREDQAGKGTAGDCGRREAV